MIGNNNCENWSRYTNENNSFWLRIVRFWPKNVDGSFVVSTSQDNNVSFMIVIKEESIGKELVAEASSLVCI